MPVVVPLPSTDVTEATFRALNRSSFGWMLTWPTLNVFETFRSSWLMRSPYSVIGATSGTDNDAWVMLGSTSAPTTQPCAAELPGQEVYRVVGVINHTVPSPAGLASCNALGAPLGPETPVS